MLRSKTFLAALVLLCAHSAFGYVLEGQKWTLDRTVTMQLSLGGPTILTDGSTSFNQVAQDALNLWNPYMAHMTFATVLSSPVTPAGGDDENSAFFSNTVFGDSFGTGALAVTLLSFRGSTLEESDTVFNNTYVWDSYRGSLRAGVQDFRRVAIHEFGHALGLDHPDEHKQTVVAIMNSHVSGIDTLQADDIAGAKFLYATGPAYQSSVDAPVLANIATRGLIGTGDNVLIGGFIVQGTQPATVILRGIGFSLAAVGLKAANPDPVITVYDQNQNQVATNDDWFVASNAATIASYHLDPSNSRESALYLTLQPGAYTAIVEGFSDGTTPPATGIGLVELYDLHTTGGRAGNIATRGQVLTADDVLIGGFIIGGADPKPIVIRALGPSLGSSGVINPLADPNLELHDSNGAVIQSNDNWQAGPDAQTITDNGLAPKNANESAIFATLAPGSYTAIVSGVGGATGIGLVEAYDLSPVP